MPHALVIGETVVEDVVPGTVGAQQLTMKRTGTFLRVVAAIGEERRDVPSIAPPARASPAACALFTRRTFLRKVDS
jgi:hypothetical protein